MAYISLGKQCQLKLPHSTGLPSGDVQHYFPLPLVAYFLAQSAGAHCLQFGGPYLSVETHSHCLGKGKVPDLGTEG